MPSFVGSGAHWLPSHLLHSGQLIPPHGVLHCPLSQTSTPPQAQSAAQFMQFSLGSQLPSPHWMMAPLLLALPLLLAIMPPLPPCPPLPPPPQSHGFHEFPSSLHVWTPVVPPEHAHVCVAPGLHAVLHEVAPSPTPSATNALSPIHKAFPFDMTRLPSGEPADRGSAGYRLPKTGPAREANARRVGCRLEKLVRPTPAPTEVLGLDADGAGLIAAQAHDQRAADPVGPANTDIVRRCIRVDDPVVIVERVPADRLEVDEGDVVHIGAAQPGGRGLAAGAEEHDEARHKQLSHGARHGNLLAASAAPATLLIPLV